MTALGKRVLVLGNYRQTLTVIRSLGRAGYHVIAGRETKRDFVDYCRYTAEVWEHPAIKGDESSFVAALNDFLTKTGAVPLIFPIGDTQISCIARNFDRLPASVAVVMPDPATAMKCEDKTKTYEIIENLGIPQPRFQKARSYSELRLIVERIGYPCVIKPNDSSAPFFDEKAIIVNSLDEIVTSIPAWPEGHECLVVQEFVRGERHNCDLVAVGGEIVSYFEFKTVRTDRRDGTGITVDGVSIEPTRILKELSQILIEELEYSGPASVQFLIDSSSGAVNFLEINPRLNAACALAFHSGHDHPKMAVENTEYLIGARADRSIDTFKYLAGRRFDWLAGDLEGIMRDARAGRLNVTSAMAWLQEIVVAFLRGGSHATWWWKDPLPTFLIYWRLFKTQSGF